MLDLRVLLAWKDESMIKYNKLFSQLHFRDLKNTNKQLFKWNEIDDRGLQKLDNSEMGKSDSLQKGLISVLQW